MRNGNKFARLGYAHEDKIQGPTVIKNWYLKKFGACEKTEEIICGERGLHLLLPITQEQAEENQELAGFFAQRAAEDLAEQGVGIVLQPKGLPVELPGNFRTAKGEMLFAFLIMPILRKVLSLRGLELKRAEILIIDNEPELTECLIENIYPHVNYLSLATQESDYSQRAAEIFEDCGLNLCVTGKNRHVQELADVVISTGATGVSHYFKRDAIYLELGSDGGNRENFLELLRKRPDLLAADGISARLYGERTELRELEAVFYSTSREYRRLVWRGFEEGVAREFAERINAVPLEGLRLTLLGKAVG